MNKSKLLIFILPLILVAGLIIIYKQSKSHKTNEINYMQYGTKVIFVQGQPIEFEDFNLVFIGTHKAPPMGNLQPTYYDFEVSRGSEKKQFSWSAGFGNIGPKSFEFAGESYTLELKRAEPFGQLNDNELVIKQLK
jgi:hypothetical protein